MEKTVIICVEATKFKYASLEKFMEFKNLHDLYDKRTEDTVKNLYREINPNSLWASNEKYNVSKFISARLIDEPVNRLSYKKTYRVVHHKTMHLCCHRRVAISGRPCSEECIHQHTIKNFQRQKQYEETWSLQGLKTERYFR